MQIRAVVKGERVGLPVQGGYCRQHVPADGLVLNDGEGTVFITEEQARAALRDLEALRRSVVDAQCDVPD